MTGDRHAQKEKHLDYEENTFSMAVAFRTLSESIFNKNQHQSPQHWLSVVVFFC